MKSMAMGPFEKDPSPLAKPGINIKELKQHVTMAVLQVTRHARGDHGHQAPAGATDEGLARTRPDRPALGAAGVGVSTVERAHRVKAAPGTASRSSSTSATPGSTWGWPPAKPAPRSATTSTSMPCSQT